MTCELVNPKRNRIFPMRELSNGELGVVIEGICTGVIVQPLMFQGSTRFIALGSASAGFDGDCALRVRILEEGELIEVKYS